MSNYTCPEDHPHPYTQRREPTLHRYKIHGALTVLGKNKSANTSVFYDSLDEAREAAKAMALESGGELVIFEAIEVVRSTKPPVEVARINADGSTSNLWVMPR
jgi:hypothetical protein